MRSLLLGFAAAASEPDGAAARGASLAASLKSELFETGHAEDFAVAAFYNSVS